MNTRVIGRLATVAATAATAAALTVVPAGTASAAPSCWDAGFEKAGYQAHYCENVSGVPIREHGTGKVIDYLRTTTSWFACKIDNGPGNAEGQPHPNRWLWTQGDDNGEWGWVSDKYIYGETNPLPNCYAS